jgi:hypothetical protein
MASVSNGREGRDSSILGTTLLTLEFALTLDPTLEFALTLDPTLEAL